MQVLGILNGVFVTLHLKRNLDLQIASTTTVGTSLVLAFATSNESSHPDSDMDQWSLQEGCTPESHAKSRSDNVAFLNIFSRFFSISYDALRAKSVT